MTETTNHNDGATFECPGCGNRTEDANMRLTTCVHCGDDLELADDQDDDAEPVVYRVGCDGCDTVHYTIDELDKCPDCGRKTLESLGFVGDADLAERIDALDLPDEIDPGRLDAVTAREVLERYGPADGDTTEDVEQNDADESVDAAPEDGGEYPLLKDGHDVTHVDDLPGIGRSTAETFAEIHADSVFGIAGIAYNVGTPNEKHSPDWIERHANILRRKGAALPDDDALDTLLEALRQSASERGHDPSDLALEEIEYGYRLENDAVDVSGRIASLEDAGLSGREAQVTAWKEQGLTHEAIADEIGASKSTVDEYSRRAARKLEKARALVATAGDVYK